MEKLTQPEAGGGIKPVQTSFLKLIPNPKVASDIRCKTSIMKYGL